MAAFQSAYYVGPTRIEIAPDAEQMRRLEQFFGDMPKVLDRILKNAINRAVRKARSEMVKRSAKALGARQKTVRRRTWISRATARRLIGRARAGRIGFPLAEFSPRQTNKGVVVRLRGERALHEHAFIATMPYGHRGVFRRRGRARLPIQELRTESLTEIIEGLGVTPDIIEAANRVLMKRIEHGIQYELEKRWSREEKAR